MDFDWKKLIGTIAPTLATALGGPLAGMATTVISQAVLGKPDAEDAEIATALASASPDMLLKIKEADQTFAAKMKELDIDLEKIAADDRNSARQREMFVKDTTPRNLAYLYTAGYFVMIAALFKFGAPEESRDLLNTLVGILSAAEIGIITYYFGSSAGSAHKTNLMATAIKK